MSPGTLQAQGTPLERYQGSMAANAAMLALCALGLTPQEAGVFINKRGGVTFIAPIAGGDDASLEAKITELTGAITALAKTREEANPNGAEPEGGRYAAATDGSKAIADQLAELHALKAQKAEADAKAARTLEVQEAVKAAMAGMRIPSGVAGAIAGGGAGQTRSLADRASAAPTPSMKAIFGDDYEAGTLLSGIGAFKGLMSDGIDIDVINAGKAALQKLGVIWAGPADLSTGKATLGTTGATGGYVLPNNLVDSVVKPRTQAAIYRNLVTVINGVAVRGVDQPYRLGIPTRMTAQDWGAVKENVNETYGSYTASLVTFARIYDIAKQYLRFSAGAAERDVLDELTKAADLAENYEIIAGPGTGSIGSGDACLGVYTSLAATPTFLGYKGAKTGAASNSTLVGSLASAVAELLGLLAARYRTPSAIIVDSTTYFTALAQGTDTAGFWVSPEGGPTGFTKTESGGIAFWGVPLFYDTNLAANATTKIAIAAEWDAFKLYRGMEFRIDSSDVAGERWDRNLVGFRGEMELGFNAETPVHVGAAQLMTSVIP